MVTDPIADLLTRMRNAARANQEKTIVPHSKLKIAILKVLKGRKFIADFKEVGEGINRAIEIYLDPALSQIHLRRVSKPGQRIYVKKGEIRSVRNGYGIAVLSTPVGVISGGEAYKKGVGGEYICEVW